MRARGSRSRADAERSRRDASGVRGAEPPRRLGADHRRAGDRHRDRRLGCRPRTSGPRWCGPSGLRLRRRRHRSVARRRARNRSCRNGSRPGEQRHRRRRRVLHLQPHATSGGGAGRHCTEPQHRGGDRLRRRPRSRRREREPHRAELSAGARARDQASTCRRRVRRGRRRQRGDGRAPVPGSDPRNDLGRSFDVRREEGGLLQPRPVGEVRRARVRSDRRTRRWLGRRLRDVDVGAARGRDRRAHAHSGSLRVRRRHRGSACTHRPRSARNAVRSPRRRRRVAPAREPGAAAAPEHPRERRARNRARSLQRHLGRLRAATELPVGALPRRELHGDLRRDSRAVHPDGRRRRAPAASRHHGGGARRGSIRADAVRRDQAAVRDAADDRRDASRRHAAACAARTLARSQSPVRGLLAALPPGVRANRAGPATTACVPATADTA